MVSISQGTLPLSFFRNANFHFNELPYGPVVNQFHCTVHWGEGAEFAVKAIGNTGFLHRLTTRREPP